MNVLYGIRIQKRPEYTSASIIALAVSAASTLVYTLAALWTYRKIYMIKSRDKMHRHYSESSTDTMKPETEQQRQQLLRLLLQEEGVKHGSPDTNQSTFKLEMPPSNHRTNSRSTMGTLKNLPRVVRDTHERTGSMYGPEGYNEPTAATAESVEEGRPSDSRIAPLPAIAYVPPQYNFDEAYIPGMVNTRSYSSHEAPPLANLPQLQEDGYPLEKAPPLKVLHPLERSENQYRIVEDHQPTIEHLMALREQSRSTSRVGTQRRESRRIEIELADRGRNRNRGLGREDLDGIEIVPSIKRVETDGWIRQTMSDDR